MKLANNLPQFQFIGKLGTGGTAEVSKVLTKENKVAALKTILQSENINQEEFKLLAIRERILLQDINFPGIVKVYEVQTDEPCYICLEFCSGKTLEHYNKIKNSETALNILSSIAVNLEFLHLNSIIHADLQPDNIFMPEDISSFTTGNLTFTKLSDFSLGKFEHEDSSVRAGVGTIGYMAPETIKDNIVTHQSDLFALGVIAYQLLTGVHPFITDDADPVKINSRILEEEPRSLKEYQSDISDSLIQIVSSLLEKESTKRPCSAWEVCQMLRKAGATYPFEKALNPKYIIHKQTNYNENKNKFSNYCNTIDTISNQDSSQLRLIVADNFRKNNIFYENKNFHFKDIPLVGSRLIRKTLASFMNTSYKEKKTAIELSFHNNNKDLISSLLPHLLHYKTVKRISNKLANRFEQEEKFCIAAQLYVQAGDLLKAENSAYQAAMQFKNENNINRAIELLNKVISYGTLLNRRFEIKSLLMVKGDFLKDVGEVERAEIVYNELIELYVGHREDELLAETYKDLGALYQKEKKPQEGIKSLEKALDIFKKLKNELEISKTYNNLGNTYAVVNNYTTALSYYRKALRIQRKLSAEVEVASTLNNIGTAYAMTNKFHKALKFFKISLSLKKEIGNKGEIARALNNIGYCYEVLGHTQKAAEMLLESLQYNKEIDSKKEILINLENLTTIMFDSGQLKESIIYLKEGTLLATELKDNPHTGLFNLYMGTVLVRMGKLKEALSCFGIVEDILNKIAYGLLSIELQIEKARIALLINNKTSAAKHLDQAHTINKTVKDKTILVKLQILQIQLNSDKDLLIETEEIIDELGLSKEKTIINALKLNNRLDNDRQAYEQLSKTVENSDEHIEQCHLLLTLAKYELSNNDINKATDYTNKSLALSKSRGLLFDRFDALILLGKILSKQKEIEKCFSVYKQALEIAKNIYGQLESDEDKKAFQSKKEFMFLVTEIKKLSQILGQKKEQV